MVSGFPNAYSTLLRLLTSSSKYCFFKLFPLWEQILPPHVLGFVVSTSLDMTRIAVVVMPILEAHHYHIPFVKWLVHGRIGTVQILLDK